MIDWLGEADVLVEQVPQVAPSTTVTRDRPTDHVLVIKLHPSTQGAADLHLVVSENLLIVDAGQGMHFDLGPLPGSRDEAKALMLGVVNGGLTERIASWGVGSTLVLSDGTMRKGWSGRGCFPRPRRARVVRYEHY